MTRRLDWLRQPAVGIWVVVLLGLAFRSYHFLRQPSVWHDEAAVLVNVIERGFFELLGPLRFSEAAPPLFLWLEKCVALGLGERVPLLRLVPFLASCASLVLMVPLARLLLSSRGVFWAVLLFAVSEQMAWHACEAKPYALDVFAATLLLYLFCRWRAWPVSQQLLCHALLAPVLLTLCYPACFLYGGLLVAFLPAVWRERQFASGAAYTLLGAVVAGTFLGVVLPIARLQHDEAMASCWVPFFPDWNHPWTVPLWVMRASLEVLRYCFKPCGQVLIGFVLLGAANWWRTDARPRLLLSLVPVGLALLAALVGRYPYGGARVMLYAAPGLLLLIAQGADTALAWLQARRPLAFVAVVLVLLTPTWGVVHSLARPWPRADTASAAAWILRHRRNNEVVLGNDWTHIFYFRHLGEGFRETRGPLLVEGKRLWAVWTEQDSADERWRHVQQRVPAGWQVKHRRDFLFTTVVLLERPTTP